VKRDVMSILPLVNYGAAVLRRPAEPVSAINEEVQKLIDDMAETMFAAPGAGLAAPQVGIPKRIIVLQSPEDSSRKDFLTLINPEIVSTEGKVVTEEGCLSIPEFRMEVPRAEKVVVRALDREGKPIEMEGVGLMARVLQHEIDHLNGLLYIDRLSPAKRDVIKRKLKKSLA
jgi:peptide deformylase